MAWHRHLLALALVAPAAVAATVGVAVPPLPLSGAGVRSVLLDADGHASLRRGAAKGAAAWGRFNDVIDKTGWSVLDVHTSPEESGARQSYAAGYLEGALSQIRMTQHIKNLWGVDFAGQGYPNTPDSIHRFVADNVAWMRQQARERVSDRYWVMVGFLLEQLRGLTDGYNAARGKLGLPAVPEAQVLMNSMVDTDMDDAVTAVEARGHFVNEHYRHHSRRRRSTSLAHRGHCSALVQAAPGNADLWVGHATWDEYRSMLRVIKRFDMPLPGAAARRVVFTSNPGALYSGDDWYVTDTGLTITETSIENYNRSRWTGVRHESLLTWARALVATRLAASGEEWTELELRHQSGTCNNQWMVVDYKRFTPGQPLRNGTLWVSEAMPGMSHREDVTHVLLDQGSWPSYNIPYFKDVWTSGGYGTMQQRHPDRAHLWSFTEDPRAQMFARARGEGSVTSMSSFMKLLRYNHRGDRLAKGDACNGISARCDLNPHDQEGYDCFGAIDAKMTGWRQGLGDLSFYAVSSPTHDAEEPPFSWIGQNASVDGCRPHQHVGHPDVFGFSWYAVPSSLEPQPWTYQEEALLGLSLVCVMASALALRWGFAVIRKRRPCGRQCGDDMSPVQGIVEGYARF